MSRAIRLTFAHSSPEKKKKRNREVKYRGTHGQPGFILLSCQQLARKQVLSLSLSKPHTLLLLHNSTNKHTTRALRADNPYATITLKEKNNNNNKKKNV